MIKLKESLYRGNKGENTNNIERNILNPLESTLTIVESQRYIFVSCYNTTALT